MNKGLVINNGGGGGRQNGRGHVMFYPYGKRGGGAEKVLAMLKGARHNRFWGSVYAVT